MQLTSTPTASDELMAALTLENRSLRDQIAALKQQVDWFKRQLFGQKSERFMAQDNPHQLHLGEALPVPEVVPEER